MDSKYLAWIKQLIINDNLILFYKDKPWLDLRQDVLDDYHNECQDCLSRGHLVRAVTVHHEEEVKRRPDLALSKTYKDDQGKERRQLTPLCDRCHNRRHGRFCPAEQRPQLNKERW